MLSAFIAGSNTTQQQSYVYHDTEPYYNATYYYWLESADLDGSSEFFGPVSIALDFTYVNPPTIPLVTELSSVYPNPFNPETTISYTVAKRSEVQLSIYNVKGQLVRRLVQDFRNPGHYRVNWNGRDEQSRLCSSGSYQIVMRVGTDVFTRKALLLK
ncbi:MAG TPA: FlgD immunoglobulin-like domain containing protein [Candidatus Syntrophosphaera sp.]|nr:FlgD immunoglobulin-like domain containing protein [Candidatus Syntrophosphaera sp.]